MSPTNISNSMVKIEKFGGFLRRVTPNFSGRRALLLSPDGLTDELDDTQNGPVK